MITSIEDILSRRLIFFFFSSKMHSNWQDENCYGRSSASSIYIGNLLAGFAARSFIHFAGMSLLALAGSILFELYHILMMIFVNISWSKLMRSPQCGGLLIQRINNVLCYCYNQTHFMQRLVYVLYCYNVNIRKLLLLLLNFLLTIFFFFLLFLDLHYYIILKKKKETLSLECSNNSRYIAL